MDKFMGALCLTAAGTILGIARARGYARQVETIAQLLHALTIMEQEIRLRLTPMPDLFRQLSRESGACQAFFIAAAKGLQESRIESLGQLWRQCAEEYLPPSSARTHFAALGDSLGCYDAAGECAAIEAAITRITEDYESARVLCDRDAALWRKLGAAGGLGAALLFL